MDLEWIISLVAVLVSLVTIIISYLTNKENLKNASDNILSERGIDFKISVWNDIIDLCDKLVLATNSDHLEQFVNITVAGKTNDTKDEDILNSLNENCEQIHSMTFRLCAKIKVLDMQNTELRNKIRAYAHDVIALYKQMQDFYLKKNATKEEYNDIVRGVNEFGIRGVTFSHTMQDYISELQGKLFDTNKRRKN